MPKLEFERIAIHAGVPTMGIGSHSAILSNLMWETHFHGAETSVSFVKKNVTLQTLAAAQPEHNPTCALTLGVVHRGDGHGCRV